MPRIRKWTRLRAARPDGEKWSDAERWEIKVPAAWSDRGKEGHGLGSGTRRVWVIPGPSWVELRDAEAYLKVRASEWAPVARKGRVVS